MTPSPLLLFGSLKILKSSSEKCCPFFLISVYFNQLNQPHRESVYPVRFELFPFFLSSITDLALVRNSFKKKNE